LTSGFLSVTFNGQLLEVGPKDPTIQKVLLPLHILLAEIQGTVGGVTGSNQEHSPPGVQSVRPALCMWGSFWFESYRHKRG